MMWCFAFKYWVVSIEMPKAISKIIERRNSLASGATSASQLEEVDLGGKNSEKQYNFICWVGIIVNVVFVLWYVIEYGKLCMNSLNDDNKVIWAKILMDCIALISGLFLGDALRRIW